MTDAAALSSPGAAQRPAFPAWLRAVLFGVTYFLVAELGTFMSVRGGTYVSFWLPAGLYVAVLLLNESRSWPWLAAGAFAGNLAFDLSHGTSVIVAVLFCVTNAVQSVTSAWLVRRYVAERPRLTTLRELFGFMVFAAALGSAIGATLGAGTLSAFDLSGSFGQSWKVWWGSNAMAILLLSPVVLTWMVPTNPGRHNPARLRRTLEAACLVAVLLALTWHLLFVDHGIMAPDKGRLVLPLLWAALRFGRRVAAAVNLLLAVLVAFFTTQAFAGLTPDQIASGEYVFAMQTTLAVAAIVALVPAIALAELREREERLRHLSRRLIEAEENERRSINRELHDRISQNLATLNLNLGMIRSQLPGEALQGVAPRMNDSQKLLSDTLGHVRDLMAELRPAALDDYGLLAALRTYAADYSRRFAIRVTVTGDDPAPRLPMPAETALFRIAQEALNNVSKHAHATAVEVGIAERNGSVTLSIADDGMGFEAGKRPGHAQSWGMATMRERAETVGARLRIESAPGRGTRVEVILPRGTA